MAIKNVINENRIQVNKYLLDLQPGIGSVLLTTISGLEEELDAVELPDRTTRSGGRKKSIEFEVTQPLHHDLEVARMEAAYVEAQDPVSPLHLKVGTLIQFDQSGLPRRKFTLLNVWVKKRVHSDLELENDGDMATITWTLQCDEILPV
jgi:hypothetical protein